MRDPTWQLLRRSVDPHPHGSSGPLDLVRVDYRRPLRTPEHEHEWDSLHLVLSGRVVETYDGRDRGAGPGGLLLYRAGVPHRTEVLGEARILHLPLVHVAPSARPGAEGACGAGSDGLDLALRLAACLVPEGPRPGARLGESLASALGSSPVLLDPRVARLTARPGAPPRLREGVRATATSRTHLSRLVRAAHGCSLGELARRRQVARAARLLLEDRLPLPSVALASGFSDQSHLGRVLRCRLGVTPGAFRRLARR